MENRIDGLNHEIKDLNTRMADPALFHDDPASFIALQKKLGEKTKLVEAVEATWATLQEEWDQKSN